jgi:hypothetical protein
VLFFPATLLVRDCLELARNASGASGFTNTGDQFTKSGIFCTAALAAGGKLVKLYAGISIA